MAATRSFGAVVLSAFYNFLLLFWIRGPIQNRSKHVLYRPFELLLLEAPFQRDIGWIFVANFRLTSESMATLNLALQPRSGPNMDKHHYISLAMILL